jgi:hypothetical protein
MEPEDLVGTWALVSFEITGEGGKTAYPLGAEARGQLVYSAGGQMAVSIADLTRLPFASNEIGDATPEEWAAAAPGYIGYSGTYTVRDDSIIHHIELSMFPNWTGTDQVRHVQLSGERLILSAAVRLGARKTGAARLIWNRIPRIETGRRPA